MKLDEFRKGWKYTQHKTSKNIEIEYTERTIDYLKIHAGSLGYSQMQTSTENEVTDSQTQTGTVCQITDSQLQTNTWSDTNQYSTSGHGWGTQSSTVH